MKLTEHTAPSDYKMTFDAVLKRSLELSAHEDWLHLGAQQQKYTISKQK